MPGASPPLPSVLCLSARLVAQEPARLPALWTTSLHGALYPALRELLCLDERQERCADCPQAASCELPPLWAPSHSDAQGRRHQHSPPLVLCPQAFTPGASLQVEPGQALDLRLALIGAASQQRQGLLKAALKRAAARGLGRASERASEPARLRRPRFELHMFERAPSPVLPRAQAFRLRLCTPLRLTRDGRVVSRLDARTLWAGLVRRARSLGEHHGAGPMELPQEPPFTLTHVDTRSVDVRRHSSRQGARMSWPGLVGELELRVQAHPGLLAELLSFASAAQLGKNTSFGFGAVEVRAAG